MLIRLLLAALSLSIVGAADARPSIAETPIFLAQYGLDPGPIAMLLTDPVNVDSRLRSSNEASDGTANGSTVAIRPGLSPLNTAYVAVHEVLHVSSFRASGSSNACTGEACTRTWSRVYEEGIVDAVAIDLLPNYWRWLTGRNLGRSLYDPSNAHYPEAKIWRAASARATGLRWNSEPARAWRRAALATPRDSRPALLALVTK